jgi:hypothetical protein
MLSRRNIFLVLCLIIPSILVSQKEYNVAKAYRNYPDFLNDKPLYQTNFQFILLKGPNANGSYKLKPETLKISKNILENGIYIVIDGDYFYINAVRQGLLGGYFKFETGHRYYYFVAQPRMNAGQEQGVYNSGVLFGAVGGAIAATTYDIENKQRSHQVFDLESGTTHQLTREYIRDHLEKYPSLLKEFNDLENNDDVEILKTYLEILDSIEN